MTHIPNLILVDDHLVFRQGIKSIIMQQNIAHVIGEASNGIELLELLTHEKPDLVIMDIDMPHMNGIEATEKALDRFPDLKIIVYTMFGDLKYYQIMSQLGIKAFVLKSKGIHELTKAINDVNLGKTYLTNLPYSRNSHSSLGKGTTAIPSQQPQEE